MVLEHNNQPVEMTQPAIVRRSGKEEEGRRKRIQTSPFRPPTTVNPWVRIGVHGGFGHITRHIKIELKSTS